MYLIKNMHLSNSEIANLLKGGCVKVGRGHVGKGQTGGAFGTTVPFPITATQAKRLDSIANGTQGYTNLKMTPSHIAHAVKSSSTLRNIWNSIKSILGPALEAGAKHLTHAGVNAVADQWGQAHPGYNLTSGLSHLKKKGKGLKGAGKRLYNDAVYNNGSHNGPPSNGLYNNEVFNTGSLNRTLKNKGIYNDDVFNTGSQRGSGKKLNRLAELAGQVGSFLLPIAGSAIANMAVKKLLGGRKKQSVKKARGVRLIGGCVKKGPCSKAKKGRSITGLGKKRGKRGGNAFTDFFTETLPSGIKDTFSKPSSALGAVGTASSFIPIFGSVLGPSLAAASLGAKLSGHGKKRKLRFKY